jgi:hypothetical protein
MLIVARVYVGREGRPRIGRRTYGRVAARQCDEKRD